MSFCRGWFSIWDIVRLKALCMVKEKKRFEARLKELKKIINDDAKSWLFDQLPEKYK
jgi:hypothetical protein